MIRRLLCSVFGHHRGSFFQVIDIAGRYRRMTCKRCGQVWDTRTEVMP